jgi:hypothetical protein
VEVRVLSSAPRPLCAKFRGAGGAGGDTGPTACNSEDIDANFTVDEGSVTCDALGTVTVPIGVVLGAKPMGDPTDPSNDFEVQAQLVIDEDTVDTLGSFGVTVATIGDASAEVDSVPASNEVNVPADTPCTVDFTVDSNDSGAAGPVVVTTTVETAAWTDVDGSVVLEATEVTFIITAPVAITLSTKGDAAECTWVKHPTVSFDSPPAL